MTLVKSHNLQSFRIGFKPFFEVCFEAKNNEEAYYYVNKIVDEAEKVKGLVLLSKWMEACEYVKIMKADPGDLIQWMKTKTTHNVWKKKVEELEEKWAAGELGSVFGDYADLNLPFNDAELPIDGYIASVEETLAAWTTSLEDLWNDKS